MYIAIRSRFLSSTFKFLYTIAYFFIDLNYPFLKEACVWVGVCSIFTVLPSAFALFQYCVFWGIKSHDCCIFGEWFFRYYEILLFLLLTLLRLILFGIIRIFLYLLLLLLISPNTFLPVFYFQLFELIHCEDILLLQPESIFLLIILTIDSFGFLWQLCCVPSTMLSFYFLFICLC